MYNISPPKDLLQQGDIFENVPLFFIPPYPLRIIEEKAAGEAPIVKIANIYHYQKPEDLLRGRDSIEVEESVAVDLRIRRALIISQTCDIKDRDAVAICPVFSFDEYEKNFLIKILKYETGQAANKLNAVRTRSVNYIFYLPAYKTDGLNLPESLVDLQYINTVPVNFLSIQSKLISLSDRARHTLAYQVSHFFGRPALDEPLIIKKGK